MNRYMKAAIEEAVRGVDLGHGGPFGAVVVLSGRVIARGHNRVVTSSDPTAHAEIVAIRGACRTLGRFDLSGCRMYTTCEPCPMCYAAAWWARIVSIDYGCTRDDAAAIGFDDAAIYEDLEGRSGRRLAMKSTDRSECLRVFGLWSERPDRVHY